MDIIDHDVNKLVYEVPWQDMAIKDNLEVNDSSGSRVQCCNSVLVNIYQVNQSYYPHFLFSFLANKAM